MVLLPVERDAHGQRCGGLARRCHAIHLISSAVDHRVHVFERAAAAEAASVVRAAMQPTRRVTAGAGQHEGRWVAKGGPGGGTERGDVRRAVIGERLAWLVDGALAQAADVTKGTRAKGARRVKVGGLVVGRNVRHQLVLLRVERDVQRHARCVDEGPKFDLHRTDVVKIRILARAGREAYTPAGRGCPIGEEELATSHVNHPRVAHVQAFGGVLDDGGAEALLAEVGGERHIPEQLGGVVNDEGRAGP